MQIINLIGELSDYREVDELHRRIHSQVAAGERPNTAILVEYQPTFTAGRRTKPEHIPNSDVPVIEVDRGGSVTWHGPGQLVCYPIVKLPKPIDVIKYIRTVESLVIDFLSEQGIIAQRVEGRSGAWILKPDQQDRKICAIGIRTALDTSMHGFALNVRPDLSDFGRIIPCGLFDAGVTSMLEEGVNTQISALVPDLIEKLDQTFTNYGE